MSDLKTRFDLTRRWFYIHYTSVSYTTIKWRDRDRVFYLRVTKCRSLTIYRQLTYLLRLLVRSDLQRRWHRICGLIWGTYDCNWIRVSIDGMEKFTVYTRQSVEKWCLEDKGERKEKGWLGPFTPESYGSRVDLDGFYVELFCSEISLILWDCPIRDFQLLVTFIWNRENKEVYRLCIYFSVSWQYIIDSPFTFSSGLFYGEMWEILPILDFSGYCSQLLLHLYNLGSM